MKAILYSNLTFKGLVDDDVPTDPEFTRIWVPTQKPVPTDGEVVVRGYPKITHTHATQVWEIVPETTDSLNQKNRVTAIRKAVDDLILIRDSPGRLTVDQLSDAVRALAKAVVALIEELRP